jgi:hypothetical protein
MAYTPGRLVQVGDIVVTGRGRKRVTYICPYLAYRHGSAPVCIFEPDIDFMLTTMLVRQCPEDVEMASGIPVCYRTEDIKEENTMNVKEIKRAVKLPSGELVAVDSLVEVEKGYCHNSEKHYFLFAKTGKAIGRVESISEEIITVDFSERYKSQVFIFSYSELKDIKLVKEGC